MKFSDMVESSKSAPAPATSSTGVSHAGAGQAPVWERNGQTHLEYVTEEAIGCLNRGQTSRGIVNLAHALVVSVEKREPMSDDQVRSYFRQICASVGEW